MRAINLVLEISAMALAHSLGFPRIGRDPYTMMMGPYDFYWFRLRWL